MDAWDFMIAGTDAEVEAEIRADALAYAKHHVAGDTNACIAIEKKYGLFGLSPEQVSTMLAEMGMGLS